MLWSGCFALTRPGISKWVGGLVIGVITGLVIGRLWVLVGTLVCLISMMTLYSGDFAELGGFQKIKLYIWIFKDKNSSSVGGIRFSVFSCSSEK